MLKNRKQGIIWGGKVIEMYIVHIENSDAEKETYKKFCR